jgi:hypothetical protein
MIISFCADFSLVRRHPLARLFVQVAGSSIGLGKQLVFASFLRPLPPRIGWCVNLFRSGPERTA